MQNQRMQGIIKMWNEQRGFGFVQFGDYPEVNDYFLHISNCLNNYAPCQGDCVYFYLGKDHKKGNIVASKVYPTGQYIDQQYFSYQYRRQIRKQIRNAKQQAEQKYRQQYMKSQKFNNDYIYERKEGYSCRYCRRQMNYKIFQCSCRNQQDYY